MRTRTSSAAFFPGARGRVRDFNAGRAIAHLLEGRTSRLRIEGWEQGADGAKYFLFGYMNRNWEEEIDVPIGPDNSFNVGGADQGQPTHFLPRRNRFVFRVRVPSGFSEKDELIWTLTTHGKTEKAYATLRPDYIVDDVVKASETGALGAGTAARKCVRTSRRRSGLRSSRCAASRWASG